MNEYCIDIVIVVSKSKVNKTLLVGWQLAGTIIVQVFNLRLSTGPSTSPLLVGILGA